MRPVRPPRSTRCEVPRPAARLQAQGRADYQEAFAVDVNPTERRQALSWARAVFELQSPLIGSVLLFVGWLLRLAPAPFSSRDHVLGMTVFEKTREAVVIGSDGPAVSLRIVVLAPAGNGPLTVSTFLRFHRVAWRVGCRVLLVAHRRMVPLLLDRVAARSALEPARCATA